MEPDGGGTGGMRWGYFAGWLFADLMLVLFLVGFATGPVTPTASPSPSGSASPSPFLSLSPSPSRSSSPSPTSSPGRELDLDGVKFTLQVQARGLLADSPAAQQAARDALQTELAKKGLDQRTAGILLAFGDSPQSTGNGKAIATKFCEAIPKLPHFSGVTLRPYWEAGAEGAVTVEIFFFKNN